MSDVSFRFPTNISEEAFVDWVINPAHGASQCARMWATKCKELLAERDAAREKLTREREEYDDLIIKLSAALSAGRARRSTD